MLIVQSWIYIVKRGDHTKEWKLENSDAWFLIGTAAGCNFTKPPLGIITRQYLKGTIKVRKNLVLWQSEVIVFPVILKYGYPFKFRYYVNVRCERVFELDSNGQFGTKLVDINKKNSLALYRICTSGDGRT